jgi:Flp pilus assembly protein TadB
MTREEANRIDQLLASYAMLDEKIDAARKDIKEIAASTHHIAGRFDEHVRTEEDWQQRVEGHIADSDDRIRQEVERQLKSVNEVVSEITADKQNRRAVQSWLTDRAKRTAILAVSLSLLAATLLLVVNHDHESADVTALLAVATPFLLLLFRRS